MTLVPRLARSIDESAPRRAPVGLLGATTFLLAAANVAATVGMLLSQN